MQAQKHKLITCSAMVTAYHSVEEVPANFVKQLSSIHCKFFDIDTPPGGVLPTYAMSDASPLRSQSILSGQQANTVWLAVEIHTTDHSSDRGAPALIVNRFAGLDFVQPKLGQPVI